MLNQSIGDNICLPSLDELANKAHILSDKKRREFADKYAKQMSVKMNDVNQFVSNLSGGNKQKVNLGRWLAKDLSILIVDCPTRGVDVGVKAYIYDCLREAKKKGIGTIMITDELVEAIGMADNIVVMKNGEVKKTIGRSSGFNEEEIIEVMV